MFPTCSALVPSLIDSSRRLVYLIPTLPVRERSLCCGSCSITKFRSQAWRRWCLLRESSRANDPISFPVSIGNGAKRLQCVFIPKWVVLFVLSFYSLFLAGLVGTEARGSNEPRGSDSLAGVLTPRMDSGSEASSSRLCQYF